MQFGAWYKMANEFLRVGGRSDSGLAKAIRTDEEGNLRTRITGDVIETLLSSTSNTSLISNGSLYITATLVTDPTTAKNIDIRKYKNVSIIVRSTHNQAVEVRLQKKVNDNYYGVGFPIADYVTIYPNETYVFDGETFPLLKTPTPYMSGEIKRKDGVAPTSGNISVYVFGEVR